MDEQDTPAGQAIAPETPLEALTRILATLNKTKAWAIAKAQGVSERITAVGGAVPAELQAVIDDINAAAAK